MRKYLFGTGIIGAITSGMTLLRSLRETQFTWRTALAWLSWGISLALAVGAIVDVRRATLGEPIAPDSPLTPKELQKLQSKAARRRLPPAECPKTHSAGCPALCVFGHSAEEGAASPGGGSALSASG